MKILGINKEVSRRKTQDTSIKKEDEKLNVKESFISVVSYIDACVLILASYPIKNHNTNS